MKIFEELEVGGYYLNGYKRVIGPIEIIDNHDESGGYPYQYRASPDYTGAETYTKNGLSCAGRNSLFDLVERVQILSYVKPGTSEIKLFVGAIVELNIGLVSIIHSSLASLFYAYCQYPKNSAYTFTADGSGTADNSGNSNPLVHVVKILNTKNY